MTLRYFLADLPDTGTCAIEGSEAHHLLHVMRASVGDTVQLFDGQGREATAAITSVQRRSVALEILSLTYHSAESPCPLHLGVALPKGERQKWLVEKCVELGVASLTPLKTSRSVAQPAAKAVERLERTVIEASKQCRRNHLMRIHPAEDFARWLRGRPDGIGRWIAHPSGAPSLSAIIQGTVEQRCVAIGPEGGFSDAEVEAAAECGFEAINLGPRILRVETAAVAVASICLLERSNPGGHDQGDQSD